MNQTIKSNSHFVFKMYFIFAIILLGISYIILNKTGEMIDKKQYAFLFFPIVFPFLNLMMFYWSFKAFIKLQKMGPADLKIINSEVAVGGQLVAVIDLKNRFNSQHEYEVVLSVSSYFGSGKDRRRRQIWSAVGFAYAEPHMNGTRLNIGFRIPEDCSESADSIFWNLTVEGLHEDAKLFNTYDIKVGKKNLNGFDTPIIKDSTEHPLTQKKSQILISDVMTTKALAMGVEILFPKYRLLKHNLFGVFFGLFFMLPLLMISPLMGPSKARGMPMIFLILFPLIGGAISLFSLYNIFTSLTLKVEGDKLTLIRSLFKIKIKETVFSKSDIERFEIKESMRSESHKIEIIYHIKANLKNGSSVVLGESFVGLLTAQQALKQIQTHIGV